MRIEQLSVAIKERKKAQLEEKVDSVGTVADFPMDTTTATVKIEEPSPPDVPIKVETRSDSPLTLSTTAPVKQEPPPVDITHSTSFTLPTSQLVNNPVGAQTNALPGLPTGRPAGSSSHNPIQIISPNMPDNTGKTFSMQPPSNLIESESISIQSTIKSETQPTFVTPLATSTQGGSPMIRTVSGGIPSAGPGSTGANLEMARKAAQQAVFQAQQGSVQSVQPSNSAVPQPGPGSVPNTQTTVPMTQQVSMSSVDMAYVISWLCKFLKNYFCGIKEWCFLLKKCA